MVVKITYSSMKGKEAINKPRTKIARAIKTAFNRVAVLVKADVKKGFREPKHGRFYGTHIASAPGEYPAINTGRLDRSLQHKQHGSRSLEVGTNLKYAPYMEFGSKRVLPRPFMSTTEKRTEHKVKQSFKTSLRGIL